MRVVTDRVGGDEMTVNGTSGGTLHPGLAPHHDLGGRLAPPPRRLLRRQGARAGQLGDEEAGGGAGGDDDGRLLQQRDWRAGGGGREERPEVTELGLLLLHGQAGLCLDVQHRGGAGLGGLGRHRLNLHLARVDNQTGREVCVHFWVKKRGYQEVNIGLILITARPPLSSD